MRYSNIEPLQERDRRSTGIRKQPAQCKQLSWELPWAIPRSCRAWLPSQQIIVARVPPAAVDVVPIASK